MEAMLKQIHEMGTNSSEEMAFKKQWKLKNLKVF